MRNFRKALGTSVLFSLAIACLGAAKGCRVSGESADVSSVARADADWQLRDKRYVLGEVDKVVGAPHEVWANADVQLVTLEDDNTPFLSKQIVGRPLWQVTIRGWSLQLPSAAAGFKDRYERTFDILVDPANGQVLKIASRWTEGIPDASDLSADDAEAQLMGTGFERYHGFPEDGPTVTFLQALDVVLYEGEGNPLEAKQIVAHYVTRSRMADQPKPVWAITLRGVRIVRQPPPPLKGSASHDSQLVIRQMRNIVDATTGAWLGANNLPAK